MQHRVVVFENVHATADEVGVQSDGMTSTARPFDTPQRHFPGDVDHDTGRETRGRGSITERIEGLGGRLSADGSSSARRADRRVPRRRWLRPRFRAVGRSPRSRRRGREARPGREPPTGRPLTVTVAGVDRMAGCPIACDLRVRSWCVDPAAPTRRSPAPPPRAPIHAGPGWRSIPPQAAPDQRFVVRSPPALVSHEHPRLRALTVELL
jgi:hypothetical protein